jgi:hypothetical protein
MQSKTESISAKDQKASIDSLGSFIVRLTRSDDAAVEMVVRTLYRRGKEKGEIARRGYRWFLQSIVTKKCEEFEWCREMVERDWELNGETRLGWQELKRELGLQNESGEAQGTENGLKRQERDELGSE